MTPSTNWQEGIAPGEAEELERLAVELRNLQHRRARGGQAYRGLHAKGQAGLVAEFTVPVDLPEPFRQGLFARPATYTAYVRFSNGMGIRQSDRKPDVRGIAIKVVGVPGKKVIPGLENAPTQDFLAILTPKTPFRDADEFVWFVLAAENRALLVPRMVGRFGLGRTLGILREFASGAGRPIVSLAANRYFSAVPIRYGPYAAKYSLAPHATVAADARPRLSPDYLGEELAERLETGPLAWDFRIQLFVDERRTPIEDASRAWAEEDAPFTTVARLTLPPQRVGSERGRKLTAFVEQLSFDPWHALVEHRPLGNMMRARNAAYRLGTQERGAAPEPDGSERFD